MAEMNVRALRLKPGDLLKESLEAAFRGGTAEAGCVLACAGSLSKAVIRFAGCDEATHHEGPFEIVSLSGTLSKSGSHVHVSLADGSGATLGGHLLPGCLVFTTAELIIGEITSLRFRRELDPETGCKELVIEDALIKGNR